MADKQIYFQTVQQAEDYWNEHYAGQHEDPDDEIADMERWLGTVLIGEVMDKEKKSIF